MNIISKLFSSTPPAAPASGKFSTKTFLRIKILSLAAEARIIRAEEKSWVTRDGRRDHPIRMGLYWHRITDVRQEARSALLAYGFLRGRSYKQLEAKCQVSPDWKRVQALVEKYGGGDPRDLRQRFAAWKDAK